MTAILSAIKPTRRPGELGVHSVDRFHFAVPDLAIAKNFYGEFGLEIDEDGGLLAMKTPGNPHVWVTLGEGPRKKLGHISFGAFDDDFDRFAERLSRPSASSGLIHRQASKRTAYGFTITTATWSKSRSRRNPRPTRSPISPSYPSAQASAARLSGATLRASRPVAWRMCSCSRETSRRRFSSTRARSGLRLSDRSGDGIAFLHGIHGSDHHMIAFVKSSAPGLHHLSWDVGSVDDIGRGAMHMLDKGFARGWGLGRHVLGSNFFHYVGDPWGSFSEYSAGIDFVPADCDWKSGDHAPEDSFYVWGPTPPDYFTHNAEA